ncbi:nucleoside diphosphate kinase [Cotonvirus japonicus]|uniref:nucleoside-diphosphate kinase n=1 Tax=Cotonvirus japonicus TaxID=2811091 RepID=A0ABM7NSK8_9VIRU|nr:nucleoside diphosphate kinase [Cotonvirus japonicus]BCS83133.1 nucleoside diphosphate kinase [Cotonvirus japonicus]
MQKTLVLIKPDAFERHLVFEILSRFEKKTIKLATIKFWENPSRNLVEKHYDQDSDKHYFNDNCDFMTSGPIMSIVFEGYNIIEIVRKLQGTIGIPGTIRGDLANDVRRNLIHASDSEESAQKEIAIWFPEMIN